MMRARLDRVGFEPPQISLRIPHHHVVEQDAELYAVLRPRC